MVKILHKPKTVINKIDIVRQLKNSRGYSMVRPEETKEEIEIDDRSLFFKKELIREKRKWLT